MRVFISWSGEVSNQIAHDLNEWMGVTLQKAETFLSSDDIRKGQRWGSEISKELEKCDFGILCLTKSNLNSPWILFEAGAISKSVDTSKVTAILFDDLTPADLIGPLVQFQHTLPDEKGMYKLLESINNSLGTEKISEAILKKAFDLSWPDLRSKIKNYHFNHNDQDFTERNERDILVEVLGIVRSLAGNPSIDKLVDLNYLQKDEILKCPLGGEYNHPIRLKIDPIPRKDTGELQSIIVCHDGISIEDSTLPKFVRGVVIEIDFFNEENSVIWRMIFTFHEGCTYYETKPIKVLESYKDFPDVIWRD